MENAKVREVLAVLWDRCLDKTGGLARLLDTPPFIRGDATKPRWPAGFLAFGSSYWPRLLLANKREWLLCGVRPRLQRRDRGGFAPPSHFVSPRGRPASRLYWLVRHGHHRGPPGLRLHDHA